MGCSSSIQSGVGGDHKQIIIATLNYGGILNSPLEFFSNSQEEEMKISKTFKQLIPQYYKQFDQKTFKWEVGKIDQKLQRQRYTPIYRANVGIQNGKLIGKEEFLKMWDSCFQSGKSKKKIDPQPTKQQIQTMRTFDLICYHALLKYVYKINQLKEIEKGNYNPSQYSKLVEKYFNRSYLNQQKKIRKVKQALAKHSADVFCFQQPTKQFIDQLRKDKKFFVKQNGPDISMLLIRIKSFTVIDDQNYLKNRLTQNQIKQLDWDADTSHIVCDKYIFISAHLSSKKQKNIKQVQQMKHSLDILKRKCSDHQIVVGADTNSFVNSQKIEDFKIFPNLKTQVTTRKKRTFLQPQFNKANAINEQCKDQIFSTLKITKSAIVTIQNVEVNKQSSKNLLPTEQHPFDHFMVVCCLQKAL